MLKIGDFSKLSRVSIRMLRHYDEIGLLKPVRVDAFTGYRYYSEEQLSVIGRIVALKNMGFGLAAIGEILECGDDKDEMERHLRVLHAELTALSVEVSERIRLLEAAMERLRKDEIMSYDVIVKELPNRQVASVRQIIPRYEHEGTLWHILCKETKDLNLVTAKPPYTSAILHDMEFKEQDVDVEIQMSVKGEYPDTEHVIFKAEPAMTVASIIFKGPYEQFSDVYACLASWIEKNGYEICGPMRDIYHVSPRETQNPEEFVTEACCPVCRKGK